ncbi:MAG: hypothetical protein ACOC3G_05145 [Phycisphaeraceae bacterium]
MRTIFTVVSLIVILHVLAAVGFIAWLECSGRLNQERIDAVIELFEPTIAEAEKREAEAGEAERAADAVAGEAMRMEAVADGPKTLQERLAEQREAEELAEQRHQRLLREKQVLRDQLGRIRNRITEMREELAREREAFEQMVERQKEMRGDEDFQQAVQLLESIKPDQAKQMMQQLLAQGETELVVEYLAAMQVRIAAKVLGSFETPAEIAQATELVERLRVRGIEPMPADSPLADGADS